MSTSNTSENNIINRISKNLLNGLPSSIAKNVIKNIPIQLYKNLKKNNLLKKENKILQEEILSEDDYKSDSLEANPDYISSTNLPYNIPVPIHENDLFKDNMQPKYNPGSYKPPKIMSTGIEGFDEEDNTNQNVPPPDSSSDSSAQETTEQPSDQQAAQQPTQQSNIEKSSNKLPSTKLLSTKLPSTKLPSTKLPSTKEPSIQQPTMQQPTMQQPTMQQPTMQLTDQPINQQINMSSISLPINIFSLDLRQLVSFSLKAIGDTYGDIYSLYKNNSPITVMAIISILLTDNRILYLGVSFLLIAIVMYIFNNFIRLPSLFGSGGGSDRKVYINNY